MTSLSACLRGGFSRVEQTLLEGGRGPAVIKLRMEFQELMRDRFEAVIEHAAGRRVIGFMSGNQQHPDRMCEVFILAPTDLVDEHEIPATGIRHRNTVRERRLAWILGLRARVLSAVRPDSGRYP